MRVRVSVRVRAGFGAGVGACAGVRFGIRVSNSQLGAEPNLVFVFRCVQLCWNASPPESPRAISMLGPLFR